MPPPIFMLRNSAAGTPTEPRRRTAPLAAVALLPVCLLLAACEGAGAAPAGDAQLPGVGGVSAANSARKWSNGVGLWGKRAATPSGEEHVNLLVKRPEDSWHKLNSLWGKRSSSWQAANGLWGKRSSIRAAPDSQRIQFYLRALRAYAPEER